MHMIGCSVALPRSLIPLLSFMVLFVSIWWLIFPVPPCLQEMAVMLECIKQEGYNEKNCQMSIKNFYKCVTDHEVKLLFSMCVMCGSLPMLSPWKDLYAYTNLYNKDQWDNESSCPPAKLYCSILKRISPLNSTLIESCANKVNIYGYPAVSQCHLSAAAFLCMTSYQCSRVTRLPNPTPEMQGFVIQMH